MYLIRIRTKTTVHARGFLIEGGTVGGYMPCHMYETRRHVTFLVTLRILFASDREPLATPLIRMNGKRKMANE